MQSFIDIIFCWPTAYVIAAIFIVDLLIDRHTMALEITDLMPMQCKAFLLAVPVSIILTVLTIAPLPASPDIFAHLFYSCLTFFIVLSSCYYKDKFSDLAEEEDCQSHWLLKTGLLLVALAIMWVWF